MPNCLELGLGFAVVVASDKLFYWLFQHQPDRILPLLPDLPADARGYRFSAPVLKERPELPALILEAQMAADAGFLRRLYAETARLVQAASWAAVGGVGACGGVGAWKVATGLDTAAGGLEWGAAFFGCFL